MSESIKFKGERFESLLKEPEHLALPDATHAEKLREGEKDPIEALAEARTELKETIKSDTQVNPLERLQASEQAAQPQQSLHINQALKSITLQRELKSLQRKLSFPQRSLSKVIHQPLIRAVSETAGQTVSRPSGLLGGSLVAFLGTSAYIAIAKHAGFTYNYSVFIALFIGGFLLGLGLELAVYVATASRRHAND